MEARRVMQHLEQGAPPSADAAPPLGAPPTGTPRVLHRLVRRLAARFRGMPGRGGASEALRESEIRKAAILEAALDCVVTIDAESRITEFNPAAERIFGYRRDDVIGQSMPELIIPPVYRQAHYDGLARYLATGEAHLLNRRCELSAMRADGSEFPVELTIIRMPMAGPPSFTAFLRDITQRKRAEAALRESEARYRALVDAHAQIVWTMAASGEFAEAQLAWSAYTGQQTDELMAWGWLEAVHPADRESTQAVWMVAVRDRAVCQFQHRLRRHDGVYRSFAVRAVPILNDDGTVREWVGTHTDITEREAAIERTRRLQQVTAALSEAVTPTQVVTVVVEQGIAALEARAGSIALLNARGDTLDVLAMVGYDPEVAAAFQHVPLDARFPLSDVVRTGAPLWLRSRVERDARYPNLASVRAANGDGAMAAIPLVVHGRTIGAMGLNFRDTREFSADDAAFALALAQQCAQALDRARLYAAAENARATAELANAAKSQFLATMSHEIRTPINAIQGYGQLLEFGIAGPVTDQQRTYLARIAGSAEHLLGLINDVLDLAKVDAGELRVAREPALVDTALRTALDLTRPQAAARGVRLVDQCASDTGITYVGDEHRVRQILINLLSNAIKFTSTGGTVTISCGTEPEMPPEVLGAGGGPWAYVRVTDTGIGIAPEELRNIFDAFHQVERGHTRTRGGTGLGLTISLRLARLMGGDVTIASTVDVGSTFTLWLPATADATAAHAEGGEAHAVRAPSEPTSETPGLSEVGKLLRDEIDGILAAYTDRLRSDPEIPRATDLPTSQLEDHVVSMLADFAQSLVIIADAGDESGPMLGDSSTILRAIAEAHGMRRQAQGWPEAAVRREYEILREVMEQAVRARVPVDSAGAPAAIRALFGLLDRAEASSLGAWRRATQTHGPVRAP
jgi:PAS domain S-box-containing protein